MSGCLRVNILTYFKQLHLDYFNNSPQFKTLLREGKLELRVFSFLEYAIKNKIRTIDDKPYGSLSGLILRFDFFSKMVEDEGVPMSNVFHMSPSGDLLTHSRVLGLNGDGEITVLCSRYEGVDSRIVKFYSIREISIGDYVLYDGDTSAFVFLNSVIRHRFVKKAALLEESVSSGLLEYDQFTRPAEHMGLSVPAVLRSGNHNNIAEWKLDSALCKTKGVRPEMYEKYKAD